MKSCIFKWKHVPIEATGSESITVYNSSVKRLTSSKELRTEVHWGAVRCTSCRKHPTTTTTPPPKWDALRCTSYGYFLVKKTENEVHEVYWDLLWSLNLSYLFFSMSPIYFIVDLFSWTSQVIFFPEPLRWTFFLTLLDDISIRDQKLFIRSYFPLHRKI